MFRKSIWILAAGIFVLLWHACSEEQAKPLPPQLPDLALLVEAYNDEVVGNHAKGEVLRGQVTIEQTALNERENVIVFRMYDRDRFRMFRFQYDKELEAPKLPATLEDATMAYLGDNLVLIGHKPEVAMNFVIEGYKDRVGVLPTLKGNGLVISTFDSAE